MTTPNTTPTLPLLTVITSPTDLPDKFLPTFTAPSLDAALAEYYRRHTAPAVRVWQYRDEYHIDDHIEVTE